MCAETIPLTFGQDGVIDTADDLPARRDDPWLRIGPTDLTLDVDGTVATIRDLDLERLFHLPGRGLRGWTPGRQRRHPAAHLAGGLRRPNAICELAEKVVGVSCVDCGGGAPYCLGLVNENIQGDMLWDGGLTLRVGSMNWKKVGFPIVAVALGSMLALAIAEGVLRIADRQPAEVPKYLACDCPHIYGNNPEREEISSQGLRDREFEIPKPANVARVLILGDSVTYAGALPVEKGFAKLLERQLRAQVEDVEVVNASAEGYSTYNEWTYYRDVGRTFQPDVVVTQLCLNDIINPRLHWGWARELGILEDLPAAAIPNIDYDEQVRARLASDDRASAGDAGLFDLDDSRLYRRLRAALARRSQAEAAQVEEAAAQQPAAPPAVEEAEQSIPTYLTLEDSLPITAWLEEGAPEWAWIRSTLDRLTAAVEADGARHMLLIVPLGYQLDPAYPHRPQERLAGYCTERGLTCIDPLGAMQRAGGDDLFVGNGDVWHLGERGHELTAELLFESVLPALVPQTSPDSAPGSTP